MEPLHTLVDELVFHIGRLSPEDEAAQKDALWVSSKTEAIAQNRSAGTLPRGTRAFSSYVKKMAAEKISGTAPLEEAVIPIKTLSGTWRMKKNLYPMPPDPASAWT